MRKIPYIIVLLFLQSALLAQNGDAEPLKKYQALSDSLSKISDYKNAILAQKHRLNLLQAQRPVPYVLLVKTHRTIGFYYRKWGKFGESKYYQIKAVEIAEQHLPPGHEDVARSYNSLGSYYLSLSQNELSYRFFKKALDLGAKYGHDRTGDYYNNVGIAQQQLGEKDSALVTYHRAMEYNRSKFGFFSEQVANNFLNLGTLYSGTGKLEQAIYHFDTTGLIYDSILPADALDFASLYNNLGAVHTSKGDFRRSLYYLEKGLEIFEKHHGSDHYQVANIYANIGLRLMEMGDLDKALSYFKKAHSIRLEQYGEKDPNVAKSCQYLGNCYLAKRHYDDALIWLEKAVKVYRSLSGIDPGELAIARNDLGLYHEQVGNYNEALKQYREALRINARKLEADDPDVADSYARIGQAYLKKEDYDEAGRFFQKALQIRQRAFGDAHPKLADAYRLLALSCPADTTCFEEYLGLAFAAQNYVPGETEFDQVPSTLVLLRTFQTKGELLHGQFVRQPHIKILEEADQGYRRSIELIEFIKTTLEQPGSRLALQDNFYLIYEDAIWTKYQLHLLTGNKKFLHEAFKISEQSNAILLMEALQSVDAERFAGIPDSLLQLEHQLKVDLTFLEKLRFEEELNPGGGDPKNIAKLNDRIFKTQSEYHDLLTYFRKNHGAYFEMKYAPKTVTVEKIQQQLLRPDQTMLAYFVGEQNVFVFIISASGFSVAQIPKEFPLEIWVEEFRNSIAQFNPAIKELAYLNQKFANIGHELYLQLFEPLAPQISTKSLVIVPGGMLGYLPFDALLVTSPEKYNEFSTHDYFIRHYQVSYSYSATLLEEMMESTPQYEPFIAFAPAYFGDTLTVNRSDDPWRAVLGQLQFNEQEVLSIQEIMGGQVLLDSMATEENFLKYAPLAGILHLATHGKSNDRHGEYSYLAFFQKQDSVENELLFVKNLYNLHIPAALVVLSACETGIGELQRGEGIVSLARGFSYAGAASIVTTMWNIDDRASSDIMLNFYRQLKRKATKDEALRSAKLDYLKKMGDSNRTHPLFWAAFVPVGDMSPLPAPSFPWWGWGVFAGLILAACWWVFFD